jgi:hypothetical protein
MCGCSILHFFNTTLYYFLLNTVQISYFLLNLILQGTLVHYYFNFDDCFGQKFSDIYSFCVVLFYMYGSAYRGTVYMYGSAYRGTVYVQYSQSFL